MKEKLKVAANALIFQCLLWAVSGNSYASDLIDFEQYKGKYVLYLDFWASWCIPCRESFPWINKINSDYGDAGLKVIAINLDSNREDADNFLKHQPANFEMVFDPEGKLAQAFDIQGMPSSVLIGRNGKVYSQHIGFNAGRTVLYENTIRKLLGEE
ncbi:MAG: redoxin [Moraxellaceae bacterium]|nr:MAG: redoxin [Moraxellaceae bacterium]